MLIILFALTFSYAMFQGGFVSWFLFFSFFPFGLYSLFLHLYSRRQFKVERLIEPKDYCADDHMNVTIMIRRRMPLPLFFLIVEDITPVGLDSVRSKQVLFPGFKRELQLSYRIDKASRGEHIFEAIRLTSGDVLGIAKKEWWFDCRESILVYPKFEEMIYRPLENRFEQGGTTSAMQFQKDTSLVAGVRQYQPGDRFAWIDWKATARTNEMMSKEFEIRQSNDLFIVLDRTHTENFEEMVKFTASAIRAILRNGGQVGLLSAGKERTIIPIKGGEQQQQQIFHHLAKVNADSTVHLANLIEGEAALYNHPAALILITSTLDKQLIDRAGMYMRRKGTLIIYLIKKRRSISHAQEMKLKASALKSGLIIKTLYDGEFRTAFSEVMRA
ncbi:DUF58 domain-containing protein [Lederbergia citrea]|uniref:DUF58 domain-containing protein n=1 Tax=Lederbergia citrea TaxID=2833581 RepID=A0A942UTR5_9BACI|nr:DUF58 domain-containing protein [Lederbergia citrea]MBS4179483.1 DUF58 domain-containing protein [Lederbergia citrea]MBS4224913.1 DUF58 domain-containing protein [Lederbergia citrea]